MNKKTIPVSALLDQTNQMLKARFSVKYINYVTDNGIIHNGWVVSKKEAIKEAVDLLKVQKAPIYILGRSASAIIGWNNQRTAITGSLWQNAKEIEKFDEIDYDKIYKTLIQWFKKVR
jgi:hypothetical protein